MYSCTRKSCVKISSHILQRNSLINWSGTSNRKFYKRIPFNFDKCSFYKGFPWEFFFTRKSFVKFFWNFKLESDFFPHFFCKIRKLENSANLFILNYNWANFQRNQRTFLASLTHFTSLTHSLHFTLSQLTWGCRTSYLATDNYGSRRSAAKSERGSYPHRLVPSGFPDTAFASRVSPRALRALRPAGFPHTRPAATFSKKSQKNAIFFTQKGHPAPQKLKFCMKNIVFFYSKRPPSLAKNWIFA